MGRFRNDRRKQKASTFCRQRSSCLNDALLPCSTEASPDSHYVGSCADLLGNEQDIRGGSAEQVQLRLQVRLVAFRRVFAFYRVLLPSRQGG